MKLEKKHWIIIGVIVTIIVIWYFLRKKPVKTESAFRGGRGFHGHGGRGGFYGGRGRWGGGYPFGWGYPYPYYDDEPIVIGSSRCPEGWVWMGAIVGCVKPQGQ